MSKYQSIQEDTSHHQDKTLHVNSFIPRWTTISSQSNANLIRDMLSLERTYLSWVRTSLAMIALGVAAQKLIAESSNRKFVEIVCSIFISTGVTISLYSYMRFHVLIKRVQQQSFTVDTIYPLFFVMFGISCGVLAYLLVYI
jgi:putative membrane protein